MKRDESLSPSLFTFHSRFAAIHHHWYYVFMTERSDWTRALAPGGHDPSRIDAKRRDRFLQADLNEAGRAADAAREVSGAVVTC
jgi:hypothetical protein